MSNNEDLKALQEKIKSLESKVQFYKIIADQTYDWEVFRDVNGKIVYVNDAFERITGYKKEDLTSGLITEKDIVHPDDWAHVFESISKSNSKNDVIDLKFKILRKDNEIRHINLCAKPAYENDIYVGTRTSARDITNTSDFVDLNKKTSELEASKDRFFNYINSSPTAVYLADENGNYLFVNKSATTLLGYSEHELLAMNIADILPEDKKIAGYQNFLNLKQNHESRNFEIQLKRKDGKLIDVLLDGKKLAEKEYIAYVKDITFMKDAEFKLKEQNEEYLALNEEYATTIEEIREAGERIAKNEQLFKELFNNLNSGVAIYEVVDEGRDFIFKDFNHTAERIDKQPKSELIGRSLLLMRPAVVEFGLLDVIRRVYKTGKSENHPIKLYSDGKINGYYTNFVFKLASGEIVAVFDDITERMKYEEDLKNAKNIAEENEAKHKFLFNNMTQGVIVHDVNGVITDLNPSVEKILKISKEEVIGTDLTKPSFKAIDLSGNKIDFTNHPAIISIKTGQKIYNKIIGVYLPDNTIAWLNINAIPKFKGTESSPYEVVTTFEDITDLLNAKAKAEESDALKTSFLQNMSHEIRTPLNAICGFSSFLSGEDMTDEKRKSFISIIQNSSNQLLSIVSDVLTISSLETHQEKVNNEDVNINELFLDLQTIFKQNAKNKNISIYCSRPLTDENSTIYVDRTKLTQIMTNLLGNAMKFTIEGSINFGYKVVDNMLEIVVEDTGIGIKKEDFEKIFERFRQADYTISKTYGGTGLGLSISKGFVELMGGQIWVESQVGEGSAFKFKIPFKQVKKIENKEKMTTNSKNNTILVVEDEEFNFLFIEEALKSFNLNMLHAKDGIEAIEIFEANKKINLILMDIKLPRMDGFTAAQIIRQSNPKIPIIAQSAYALEHETRKYKAFFDDYLTKPIKYQSLIEVINKFVTT